MPALGRFAGASALAALASIASVQALGEYRLQLYPNAQCDPLGFFIDATTPDAEGSCSEIYEANSQAPVINGQYQTYWTLLDDPPLDQGCAVVLTRDSTDSDTTCGQCIALISGRTDCVRIPVPDHFYTSICCGENCNGVCAGVPGKARSIDAPAPVELEAPKADVQALKGRSPFLEKKDACSWVPTSNLYSTSGSPVRATDTFQACPSESGCPISYSAAVEASFSETFGVSETTEVSLFQIVSQSVSFSYDTTYESSHTYTVTGMYTVAQGASGYLTFSPLSQCTDGHFTGDGCPAATDQPGQVCIPQVHEGQQQEGDINVVTLA